MTSWFLGKRPHYKTIAFVSAATLRREFYGHVYEKVAAYAYEKRFLVYLFTPDSLDNEFDGAKQVALLERAMRSNPAACIISTPMIDSDALCSAVLDMKSRKPHYPLIVHDVGFHELENRLPNKRIVQYPLCIKVNDHRGGEIAAKSLYLYHREINQTGNLRSHYIFLIKGNQHAKARSESFIKEWQRLTDCPDEMIRVLDTPKWSAKDAFDRLNENTGVLLSLHNSRGICGFFCLNDEMAIYTMATLANFPSLAKIPIIGFDGSGWAKELVVDRRVPLHDTIESNVDEQSRSMIDILDQWITLGKSYRPPEGPILIEPDSIKYRFKMNAWSGP